MDAAAHQNSSLIEMFSLLRNVFTKLSYLGGEGVDGGQGQADYLYGSGDNSEQYGITSSMGDSNKTDMATGDIRDP